MMVKWIYGSQTSSVRAMTVATKKNKEISPHFAVSEGL